MATDYTYHDNETMQKVWTGMRRAGLKDDQLIDVANAIMNQGVLFREPLKPGPMIPNSDPQMPVRSAYDMTFCLVANCNHARHRHADADMIDGEDGRGECYVVGCPCMSGKYPPPARMPDPITDGHPYADEVSFSEFIRLLKGAHGDAWAVLSDEGRLLLHTPDRKYKSQHPSRCRQVDFTMFVFTVMRLMEERGKPWIATK